MKKLTLLLFLIIPVITFSQDNQRKNKLESQVTFSLNSNGIASIPAFSLDNPALIASASFKKGRLSYSPILAYGLDMKPWFIDNWFHYRMITKPKFEFKTGINFSTFSSSYKLADEEIIKGERYFAFSLTGTYNISPESNFTMDYWNDNGLETGSISGHFFNLCFNRSGIRLGDKAFLEANLMLFYINYDGNNDGLFFSPTISISAIKIPASIFFQATQAIDSNISDLPGFKWNLGISYTL